MTLRDKKTAKPHSLRLTQTVFSSDSLIYIKIYTQL